MVFCITVLALEFERPLKLRQYIDVNTMMAYTSGRSGFLCRRALRIPITFWLCMKEGNAGRADALRRRAVLKIPAPRRSDFPCNWKSCYTSGLLPRTIPSRPDCGLTPGSISIAVDRLGREGPGQPGPSAKDRRFGFRRHAQPSAARP